LTKLDAPGTALQRRQGSIEKKLFPVQLVDYERERLLALGDGELAEFKLTNDDPREAPLAEVSGLGIRSRAKNLQVDVEQLATKLDRVAEENKAVHLCYEAKLAKRDGENMGIKSSMTSVLSANQTKDT